MQTTPPRFRVGDILRIVTPASPYENTEVRVVSINVYKSQIYRVKLTPEYRYLPLGGRAFRLSERFLDFIHEPEEDL